MDTGRTSPHGAERVRLLQFATSFRIGGTERQIVNLVRGLDPSRFALSIGCQRRSGQFLDSVLALDVPVREYPIRSFTDPRTVRQVARLAPDIRRDGIQVVHSYGFYANVFAVPAARLAGAPVIIASVRDIGADHTPRQNLVHRLVCGLADRVVVNADAIRRWLVAQGLDGRAISLIPNGLDMTPFDTVARSTTVRRELGLPAGAPVVLLIARLNALKGIDDFLDASARVARATPAARFVIVGDSWVARRGQVVADQAYREALAGRLAALGLEGRVVFTGFRTDVAALLAEAAVSVLPSHSEGLSNTLLESMGAGVPVVATDIGGNPEVVEQGVTGFLVPPHDPPSLADAIVKLLVDRDLAERFGAAGRRRALDHFSLDRMIARTEQLYRDLLGAAAGGVRVTGGVARRAYAGLARRV